LTPNILTLKSHTISSEPLSPTQSLYEKYIIFLTEKKVLLLLYHDLFHRQKMFKKVKNVITFKIYFHDNLISDL
jgi:hypothetical protein